MSVRSSTRRFASNGIVCWDNMTSYPKLKGLFTLCNLRLRFVFAHNGLYRSWWCCRSRTVWTLPLSPVQPICCDKRNHSHNQKKSQCEWALRRRPSTVDQGLSIERMLNLWRCQHRKSAWNWANVALHFEDYVLSVHRKLSKFGLFWSISAFNQTTFDLSRVLVRMTLIFTVFPAGDRPLKFVMKSSRQCTDKDGIIIT